MDTLERAAKDEYKSTVGQSGLPKVSAAGITFSVVLRADHVKVRGDVFPLFEITESHR